MIYGSVCSGIEAATVAWHPLGWKPAFFAQHDPDHKYKNGPDFPSAVLAHHYPSVPNLGDLTKYREWQHEPIDLLVGGTPCQSFSIAGLRGGLDDPRGNLALSFLGLADRARPRWLVWENVPGVLSSNRGRDFGSIIGAMAELGYGWAYRVIDSQYVRVDGFGRAVPQRRRRVIVVGYIGDWRRAAAVLFDRESLLGNSPPRREAGKGVAPTISARTKGGGGLGTDFDLDGGLIQSSVEVEPIVMAHGQAGAEIAEGYGPTLTCNHEAPIVAHTLLGKRNDSLAADMDTYVAHALRGEGFDASEDGMGRGTPIVPVVTPIDMRQASRGATMTNNRQAGSSGGAPGTGIGEPGDPSPSLSTSHVPAIAFDCKAGGETGFAIGDVPGALRGDGHGGGHAAIAFSSKDSGADASEGVSPTLRAMNHSDSHANGGGQVAVATSWAVRRPTPLECERLQGFPDGYTRIPMKLLKGKPFGLHAMRYPDLYDQNPDGKWIRVAADGPRYKAIGNSMSINTMRWLGRRIEMVEALS
ncbi:DNA cytosine methyltransferase [Parvibaculum sp.]|uniref:DNA cytosine methyltransferase n=1 Tax=Parvibaculum sp. TaxID=2024848 RepID=UPI0027340778|nr:DNA cytosine methyltransferase [Parvibaculum sp.]MDP3328758.1 DNA cytosine methyltransferase [Parvibaculum sp.]